MSDDQNLEDPTNRVVCVFDSQEQAEAARESLVEEGIKAERVRVFHGTESAEKVDTSAKWFADTDAEIKRYRRELLAGKAVVSVPAADSEGREKIHAILKGHDARLITHFGQWITEMMQ